MLLCHGLCIGALLAHMPSEMASECARKTELPTARDGPSSQEGKRHAAEWHAGTPRHGINEKFACRSTPELENEGVSDAGVAAWVLAVLLCCGLFPIA